MAEVIKQLQVVFQNECEKCLGEIFSGDADEEDHLEMGWKLRISGRGLLLMINSFPHEMKQFRRRYGGFRCNMKPVEDYFYMKVMCEMGEKTSEVTTING